MRRAWMGCAAAALLLSCGSDKTTPNVQTCGANARCADFDMEQPPSDDAGSREDSGAGGPDGGESFDGGAGLDMGQETDAGEGHSCNRTPASADRPRKVVVAHPFTETDYEVFDLDTDGNLTRPGVHFQMGRGDEGTIQFTPDGQLGYVVQDDGTLGIFRFNAQGTPEVLQAKLDPGFYVTGAVIDRDGDYLYAWETGFRMINGETHGAMYRLPLDCATGLPGVAEEVYAPGKLIRGGTFLSDDRVAVAATDLLDDQTENDVHLMDPTGPTRVASEKAFASKDAITAGFDATHDGKFLLIGDNSLFSDDPNTVVSVAVDGDTLTKGQTFQIGDPVRIITSPFDNAAIVLSTTEDEINVLGYDPSVAEPFSFQGPLSVTQASLLPLGADMIERGSLIGLVIIGENVGVRRVQFGANGAVTDLGLLELGSGIEQITGAVGIQP